MTTMDPDLLDSVRDLLVGWTREMPPEERLELIAFYLGVVPGPDGWPWQPRRVKVVWHDDAVKQSRDRLIDFRDGGEQLLAGERAVQVAIDALRAILDQ